MFLNSDNYIYLLGHVTDLGIAEFQTKFPNEEFEVDSNYLLTNRKLDIQSFGSLVFGLKVRCRSKRQTLIPDLKAFLTIANQNQEFKKTGFAWLTHSPTKNILILLKQTGCKKVNLLEDGKIPNHGNFRSNKTWLMVIDFKEEIFICSLDQFFNQDYWSKLDTQLPIKDMSRGMMNLKLSRSLLNLSQNKNIWDPFAGVGRTLIAGLDIKEKLLASDQDRDCKDQISKNFILAQNTFKKATAKLVENFTYSASKSPPINSEEFNYSQYSIVTEGYLGRNFRIKPNQSEIQKELDLVFNIWTEFLQTAKRLKIPEIIFCLPFYKIKNQLFLPDFYKRLATDHNYQIMPLSSKQDYILYSRKDSLVGHFVIKFELKRLV